MKAWPKSLHHPNCRTPSGCLVASGHAEPSPAPRMGAAKVRATGGRKLKAMGLINPLQISSCSLALRSEDLKLCVY